MNRKLDVVLTRFARRKCRLFMLTLGVMLMAAPLAFAQEAEAESLLGNLAPIMNSIHEERGFPMDFAHKGKLSISQWRDRGRAEVQRAFSYAPRTVSLDMTVHSVVQRDGYQIRTISFAGSPHYRIPAFLLVPDGKGPFPGVVALHDHGGWFYHGKEKLVAMDGEHIAVTQFRDRAYEGRPYAEELARRGFVVIVADAFYWGERRLQYKHPPEEFRNQLAGLDTTTEEYVRAVNRLLLDRISDMHMRMSFAGMTWGGIVNYDDRRAVDLLSSLPEVDPDRIGCVGLSGGGFRSTYLAGMEPRLKAAVIVGWMTSLPTTTDIPYRVHRDMFDPFGVHANLDHPDVATLGAPDCAIFVQNCGRDRLFTRAGMDAAVEKIRSVYAAVKQPQRFRGQYYDVPHQFNVEMQDDAFAWLERWLKPNKYFPPPDSLGGWRTLTDAGAIKKIAGMDKAKLDEAFDFIRTTTRNGGLLVVRHGYLVYENYFGKGQREATPNLGSCGKSFTSIAVGILMNERPDLFPEGLDQKIFTREYMPDMAFPLADPRMADIELGQLLSFSAGIRGNNPVYVNGKPSTIDPAGPDGWYALVDRNTLGRDDGEGYGRPFSTKTLWCEPGGGYSYATASIHNASIMLRHVTGKELKDYLGTHIAKPLGWGRWGFGYKSAPAVTHTPGGGGIALRSTDMLRFCYMLLHEGRWGSKQIVPRDYVLHASKKSPYNPHFPYSLQFNVNTDGDIESLPRDAFWKSGSGGHCLYVVPSLDLIVWKLGGRDGQYSARDSGLPEPEPLSDPIPPVDDGKEHLASDDYVTTLNMVIQAVVGKSGK